MGGLTLAAGLLLCALAVLQRRLVTYVTYPPAVFCAVWGFVLIWLSLSGTRYMQIGENTLLVYLGGAVSFSLGGALGWALFAPAGRRDDASRSTVPVWLLPALTIAVIALTPLYIIALVRLVQASPLEFLYVLRVRTLESAVQGGLGVVANVVPLALMAALFAFAVPAFSAAARSWRLLLTVFAFVLAVLTGGRSAPIALVAGLAAVASVRARTLPFGPLLLGGIVVALTFGAMGVLVRKGAANPDATARDNAVAVAENFQDYALGGLVAFQRAVDDPAAIPSTGSFLRTLKELANRFGGEYEIPTLHAQFTSIGDGITTNVYTAYFAYYPEVGLTGTLVLLCVIGLVCAAVHRSAIGGSIGATVLHGILTAAILQTVFNESFLTNINFLAKVTVFMVAMHLLMRPTLLAGHGRAPTVEPI